MARKLPKLYVKLQKRHAEFFTAWDAVGSDVRAAGPIDPKTAQLLQLAASAAIRSEGAVHSHVRRAAASAAIRSEGAVHSHVRRALEAGATAPEIRQALMLTAPTIGFPIEAGATAPEIRQALMLTAPTIGFPNVIAALSWAEDVLDTD